MEENLFSWQMENGDNGIKGKEMNRHLCSDV